MRIVVQNHRSESVAFTMAVILRTRGYPDTVHVKDPDEAANIAIASRAAIVFMNVLDENCSEVASFAAAQKILTACPDCRIIFTSGVATAGDAVGAVFGKNAQFLEMPFHPAVMFDVVLREIPVPFAIV